MDLGKEVLPLNILSVYTVKDLHFEQSDSWNSEALNFRANYFILMTSVCVCVCLYSSAFWLLPNARRLWHTSLTFLRCSDQRSFVVSISRGFCQVPSSQFLNLLYFTSKDENCSPTTKTDSDGKILKIRRLL